MIKKDKRAKDVVAVPDAFVPVIKLEYNEVELDLLFSFLPMRIVSKETIDLYGDEIVEKISDHSARVTLNGPRVAHELLKIVPNPDNFRMAYRAIKLWAKKRAVYANAIGYPAGIGWGLMLARACKLYPNYNPGQILERFFRTFRDWEWEKKPCTLKAVYEGNGDLEIWRPNVHKRGWQEIMPVITPAYPSMNSTYNVTKTTYGVIREEWIRGSEICSNILNPDKNTYTWNDLFADSEFFVRFKHYVQISWKAGTEDELQSWDGYLKSRVRYYFVDQEKYREAGILLRPHMKTFKVPDALECHYYIGIAVTQKISGSTLKKLELEHYKFDENIIFRGRTESMTTPVVKLLKRKEIPKFVFGETKEEQQLKRKALVIQNNTTKKRKWRKFSDFEIANVEGSQAMKKLKDANGDAITTKSVEDEMNAETEEKLKKKIDTRKKIKLNQSTSQESMLL